MTRYAAEDLEYFIKTEKAAHAANMDGSSSNNLASKNIISSKPEEVNNSLTVISAEELQKADLPAVKFMVEGLLPQGLSVLAAPPKYGKSWLVLDLCLSVAAGSPFLGKKTNKGRCLYLALEDSLNRLQDRMNKVLAGSQAPAGFDFSLSSHDLSNGLIEQLEAYINSREGTGVIVVDTFQKIRGCTGKNESAYASDYKEIGKLKEFADKHKLCLLLVHHLRKMADDSDVFNRISGTSGITGAADTMMVLSKNKRTDTETTLSITGRDVDRSDVVIEFNKEEYRWRLVGSAEERLEEVEYQEYTSDPIVITIRSLLNKYPLGWTCTASELFQSCVEEAGRYPTDGPAAMGRKLRKIAGKLYENDGIIYRPPPPNGSNGSRKHSFTSRNGGQASI